MTINRNNYEIYFIDYLDGTLANGKVDDLLDFLRDNPDLAAELKGLEKIKLHPINQERFDFNSLKKHNLDHPDQFDETCVRSIEGDLNEIEQAVLFNYLDKYPRKKQVYTLFQATISEPDLLDVFPNIESLKKKKRIISPIWYAAAAILVLAFVLWFFPQKENQFTQTARVMPILMKEPTPELKIERSVFIPIKKDPVILAEIPKSHLAVKEEIHEKREVETLALMTPQKIELLDEGYVEAELLPFEIEIRYKLKDFSNYQTIPEYLANEVHKFNPGEKLRNFKRGTLNTIRSLSNDKLNFISDKNGELRKVEFNSKLLAFTIPVNTEK
jgi:hypothetical protein